MLFAALDYLRYRRRRGMYSDEAIRKEGALLATPENFSPVEELPPCGLVFYSATDSFQSWLVMYYTGSVWSHVATLTYHGNIIDATTRGVIEHPLLDYLDGKSYVAIRRVKGMSDQKADRVIQYMRTTLGGGFNWIGILRLYCYIVLGAHADYQFRVSLDVIILFFLISPIALFSRRMWFGLAILMAFYLIVVALNTPKRRKMRRILADDQASGRAS